MKRYLKYGILIICALAAVGIVFYFINKPREYILKNIPFDATYCFTIDKKAFIKEKSKFDILEKDTFLKKLKANIPSEAIDVFKKIGFNPLGDMALFGQQNTEINFAWIGKDRVALDNLIKQKKWKDKKTKHFNLVKISDKLYLKYKWPIVELSNNNKYNDFFNPKSKKLSGKDLENPKTKGCIIYGFYISDREFIINYPFIPLYGRAYVGLKKEDKNVEVVYVQRRIKLKGKLGLPKKLPQSNVLISWPLDSGQMPQIKQIPSVVMNNLNLIIKQPVKHLYAELLDTISTYQEIIQYDMNDEFQLTQKIINHCTVFPGLRLQFMKKSVEQDLVNHEISKPTNLGMPILKLNYKDSPNYYVISSEDNLPLASEGNYPDYYIYANIEELKTDPFWKYLTKSNLKSIQFHAENYEKGSLYILNMVLK